MKSQLFALALAGLLSVPAAAQDAPKPQSGQAAKVDIKVSKSLAHSVKVGGDSAMAIARANAEWGDVSSAELKMMDNRLVYEVNVLDAKKHPTVVAVDAMSGEVVKDHQYGGAKGKMMSRAEAKKLDKAKKDSVMTAP